MEKENLNAGYPFDDRLYLTRFGTSSDKSKPKNES